MRRRMMASTALPHEKLVYLWGNASTTYIDTGVLPTDQEIRCTFGFSYDKYDSTVFGEWNIGLSPVGGVFLTWFQRQWYFNFGGVSYQYNVSGPNPATNVIDVVMNNEDNALIMNGTTLFSGLPGTFTGAAGNVYLFSRNVYNPGKKVETFSPSRIYSFDMIDKSTGLYVCRMIPVLKDGIPCMYDRVTGTYKYNQGSGSFGYEKQDGTIVQPT